MGRNYNFKLFGDEFGNAVPKGGGGVADTGKA